MNSTFDLNIPIPSDESEILFDLDTTQINDESFSMNDDFQFNSNPVVHDEILVDPDDVQTGDLHGPKKHVTDKERWAIYNALLERSINGKLKKYTTREVSELFSVHIATVQRIWKRANETSNDGVVDVSHRMSKCGRKPMTLNENQIAKVPLHKRTTLRSFAMAVNVSPATLLRHVKKGTIRRHSNAIKPSLNEENMRSRLQFCFSMLDKDSLLHEPKFVDMYNIVHIDEKWFYMTKKMATYYLLPSEEEPHRTCQSKNFITKVMFLAAMARPRFDEHGNETFSGKIGLFPFVTSEPAKRRSKHRDAGTMELKPLTSVKREDIKAFLLEKIVPIIHEKWPIEDRGKPIFIQQDNARTHVHCDDKEFQEAASRNGFDIRLMCQPPNSPDLNILDLGYFSAIQSLQHKTCPRTVAELVLSVEKSFDKKGKFYFFESSIMYGGDHESWRIEQIQTTTYEEIYT